MVLVETPRLGINTHTESTLQTDRTIRLDKSLKNPTKLQDKPPEIDPELTKPISLETYYQKMPTHQQKLWVVSTSEDIVSLHNSIRPDETVTIQWVTGASVRGGELLRVLDNAIVIGISGSRSAGVKIPFGEQLLYRVTKSHQSQLFSKDWRSPKAP